MTLDLEDRLRADLPRLADQLAAGPVGDAPLLPVRDVRRQRPGRRWSAAAAVLVVAAIAVGVGVARRDDGRTGTAATTTGPTVPGPLTSWDRLPDPPLSAREDAATVWTGTEWLIFGGRQGNLAVGDAAGYDPSADTWRELGTNPTPHPGSKAVWTGDVAVLFAKSGGWTYDPTTDAYEELPLQRELDAVSPQAVVWTGDAVVLAGVQARGDGELAVAARTFDPARGTWGPIAISADLPNPPDGIGADTTIVDAVWDGHRVQAWAADGTGFAFDPASDRLDRLPSLDVGTGALTGVATVGDRVFALRTSPSERAVGMDIDELVDGGWEHYDSYAAPVGESGRLVAAGDQLVVLPSKDGLVNVVDTATGASSLPKDGPLPPGVGQSVVWTGSEVLVFGGRDGRGDLIDGATSLHP